MTSIGTVTEDDAKEMIEIPNADDGYGNFYIQLDPTRLGALRESVGYVFKYPYGCMEQRSAKVLPLIAFGDYLEVFDLNREVTDAVDVARNETVFHHQYGVYCLRCAGCPHFVPCL